MRKFLARLKEIKRETLIRNAFLLPIVSVVIISISHVINWYDIGNPLSWAIYLSVAVEIFALASVSAASIRIKKGSIWLLFGLVTAIQIIGNVFFTFQDINVGSSMFSSWMELVQPWTEDWTILDHKRFLAYIQGGTLPFMSLIALHFYIKFNESLHDKTTDDTNYYDARNRKVEEIVKAREESEIKSEDNNMAFDTSIDAEKLITDILTEEIKKSEDKAKESKAERVKAPTPPSDEAPEIIKEPDNDHTKLIPDSVVKKELKRIQDKAEEQLEETVESTKEIDNVSEDTNQIVKSVKPTIGTGDHTGHRPKKNPGQHPQIMPGTN